MPSTLLDVDEDGWEFAQTSIGPKPPIVKALVPILDVATRWGSTSAMVKRVIFIRSGLDSVTESERELRKFELSDEEWENLKEVDKFLDPLSAVSQHVEGFKYPTMSCVVPLYFKLLETLKEWAHDPLCEHSVETKAAALANAEKLKKYLDICSYVSIISTILDCRLKLNFFQSIGWEDYDGENLIESKIKPV